jgi:hypothetical protein
MLIIGSLFLYVGMLKNKNPSFMYPLLIVLGIFLILYQGSNILFHGKYLWVSYFHLIIVAPLLIYIGIWNKNTPYYFYQFLIMLAFAAIGYHSYYLFLGE